MPRTELVAVVPRDTGAQETAAVAADVANGNFIQNPDARTMIRANNTGGASATITFHNPTVIDGQVLPDRVITIPAGQVFWIRLGPPGVWNQPGTNQTTFDASAATVMLQAINLST